MHERLYRYCWKNNERRRAMYGRVCRVVCRGTMNSALIEFVDDGSREVVSRNALRKVDGKMEINYRRDPGVRYPEGGGPPDEVWKDVYCASNNVIVFERRVQGKVIPPSTTPERNEAKRN